MKKRDKEYYHPSTMTTFSRHHYHHVLVLFLLVSFNASNGCLFASAAWYNYVDDAADANRASDAAGAAQDTGKWVGEKAVGSSQNLNNGDNATESEGGDLFFLFFLVVALGVIFLLCYWKRRNQRLQGAKEEEESNDEAKPNKEAVGEEPTEDSHA